MAMWNLTQEKKDELLRKKDEKHQELDLLRRTTPKELWRRDLKAFSKSLDEWEAKCEEEERQALAGKKAASGSGRDGKKKKVVTAEAMPSPHGIRVVPKINEAMKVKAAAAAAAKARKEGKAPKKEKNVKKESEER